MQKKINFKSITTGFTFKISYIVCVMRHFINDYYNGIPACVHYHMKCNLLLRQQQQHTHSYKHKIKSECERNIIKHMHGTCFSHNLVFHLSLFITYVKNYQPHIQWFCFLSLHLLCLSSLCEFYASCEIPSF